MITDINSEDRLVQTTFAEHLEKVLGWKSVYTYNAETFGPNGTLGRISERDVVLVRDLRAALERLNPDLPASAREQAIGNLTRIDFARSLVQHNREFYGFIRTGVPVGWRDAVGETRYARQTITGLNSAGNELITGLTDRAYAAKMETVERMLNHFLETGTMLTPPGPGARFVAR